MINKNWWLRFGCFLTGHNYNILKSCSEASAKAVKKYTSAILIVSILWAFTGYSFSSRYLHLNEIYSSLAGLIMVFIVIQIEKQIILNVGKNRLANSFRTVIALVMAFLGSIIIDQIIFKDDIDIAKESEMSQRVSSELPNKVAQYDEQIVRLDSLIYNKNIERTKVIDDITKRPTIRLPGYESIRKPGKKEKLIKDTLGNIKMIQIDTFYTERKYSTTSVENPKAKLIPMLVKQIDNYSLKRDKLESQKIDVRQNLTEYYREKNGFLDELEMMKKILWNSNTALFVWFLWFVFLTSIELFVVSSKWGKNNETDYDVTVMHQRDIRINAINELKNRSK